jgi:hypothetical protein
MNIDDAIALGEAYCVSPPSYEEWMNRRKTFTDFGRKYYFSLGNAEPPEKFRVFERELERCYCAKAYLACIVFADAIVGILKADVNEEARKELNTRLEYIADEIQWLRDRRNELSHYPRPHYEGTLDGYTRARGELEGEARQACAIVYHVARAYLGLDPNIAFQGTLRDKAVQCP